MHCDELTQNGDQVSVFTKTFDSCLGIPTWTTTVWKGKQNKKKKNTTELRFFHHLHNSF